MSKVFSINALTGNAAVRNDIEGDGVIDKVIRPEREGLQSSFKSQEWLFTDSILDDIREEEAAAEAFARNEMLGSESFSERLGEGFWLMNQNELDD